MLKRRSWIRNLWKLAISQFTCLVFRPGCAMQKLFPVFALPLSLTAILSLLSLSLSLSLSISFYLSLHVYIYLSMYPCLYLSHYARSIMRWSILEPLILSFCSMMSVNMPTSRRSWTMLWKVYVHLSISISLNLSSSSLSSMYIYLSLYFEF